MKQNPDETNQNRTAASIEPVFDDVDDAPSSGSNEDIRRLRPLTVLELLTESPQPLTLAQLAAQMQEIGRAHV